MGIAPATAPADSRVRVWDAPTRLGHWLLVALLAFSWWSAEYGYMEYHRYSGYSILGVLAFRLYWGFFGSSTARFARFVKGPRSVWRYASTKVRPSTPGHNPLGALSVLALLSLLIAQVALGLFTVDIDGLESGPLSHWVSFETGRVCARLHGLTFDLLLVFIGLHLVAIAFYWIVRRDNLVWPLITGWKTWSGEPAPPVQFAPGWRVVLGVVLAAALVWWIV